MNSIILMTIRRKHGTFFTAGNIPKSSELAVIRFGGGRNPRPMLSNSRSTEEILSADKRLMLPNGFYKNLENVAETALEFVCYGIPRSGSTLVYQLISGI